MIESKVKGKELIYAVEMERSRMVEKFYEDEVREIAPERDRNRDREGDRDRDRDRERDRSRDKDRDRERSRDRRDKPNHRDSPRDSLRPGTPTVSGKHWLHPSLVVRVVSKRLAHGDLYKRKIVISDVPRPGYATLRGDGGELYEGRRRVDRVAALGISRSN